MDGKRLTMTRFALPFALVLLASTAGCRHPHYSHVVYLKPAPTAVVVEPNHDPDVVVEPAPAPEPALFDRGAAATALANVDLEACKNEGAPRSTVHATLTYLPTGNISKVTIDRPAGLPVTALSCIGRQLGAAKVPAFDGPSVLVSRSFTIR